MLILNELKQRIIQASLSAGISDVGFTDAGEMPELARVMEEADGVYVNADVWERITPRLLMNSARSIIVFVCSYYAGDEPGNISRYARGADYHKVMPRLVEPAAELLSEAGYEYRLFCDSSPLPERYLACKAGLGMRGRNRAFIHPVYGSYVFIACMLTDCPFEADTAEYKECSDCGRCIRACPSGALSEDGFDARRCVSYLTQKKGELTQSEADMIKRSGFAWGCDICQQVCPHNADVPRTKVREFCEDLIYDLPDTRGISARQFKKTYANSAFAWRTKAVIERNLLIFDKE